MALSYTKKSWVDSEIVKAVDANKWENGINDAFSIAECGAGKVVSGFIEDGGTHNVGEIWLSRNNKGTFKCIVANTDNFINVAKWLQIDDLTNATKLENLINITGSVYGAPAPNKGTPIEIKVGQFDAGATTTGAVTFLTPFINHCVFVIFTDSSSFAVVGVALSAAFTRNGFNWIKSDPTYDLGGCNYMAIGY